MGGSCNCAATYQKHASQPRHSPRAAVAVLRTTETSPAGRAWQPSSAAGPPSRPWHHGKRQSRRGYSPRVSRRHTASCWTSSRQRRGAASGGRPGASAAGCRAGCEWGPIAASPGQSVTPQSYCSTVCLCVQWWQHSDCTCSTMVPKDPPAATRSDSAGQASRDKRRQRAGTSDWRDKSGLARHPWKTQQSRAQIQVLRHRWLSNNVPPGLKRP